MLVCAACSLTSRWKTDAGLSAGTVSEKQGCLSRGEIGKKLVAKPLSDEQKSHIRRMQCGARALPSEAPFFFCSQLWIIVVEFFERKARLQASESSVSSAKNVAQLVVSSIKPTILKPKGFGNNSGNPASSSLILPIVSGCASQTHEKEKPLEYCVIPTVYVVAEWWCLRTDFSATLYEGRNLSPLIFYDFFWR